jgi:membrane-associated phospholipid phosphatase
VGNPVVASYNSLLTAVNSGLSSDYDSILLGGVAGKQISPQGAYCLTLEGSDSAALATPAPAAFASDVRAAQAVECYWMGLTRDVNFIDYGTNSIISEACSELSSQPGYIGPKVGGNVTPEVVYRIEYPGTLLGPYISQLLYLPFYMGAVYVNQKIKVPTSGLDFVKTLPQVLGLESGGAVTENATFDPVPRLIRNGRDLAEWVHNDLAIQPGCHALQVLTGLGCPLNVGNPYKTNATQQGFVDFGGPHIQCLLGQTAIQALRATWFQKWNVHRTLRPEEYALRVHQQKTGSATYPVSSQVLNSVALTKTFAAQGTYLLSQAFPEGCPRHPSYPSGHATFAGATVTVLKAWFDGSFVIPNPVVPTADGLGTVPYVGAPLTVEGELNKLAINVAQGREIAGVHYRSDSLGGIELGEKIAISILRDQKLLFNESFAGFTFKKFNGTVITV